LPAKSDTHLVVAYEGAALKDFKAHVTSVVFQALLGFGSQRTLEAYPGSGVAGKLSRALVEKQLVRRVNALNLSYYDTGLVGIYAQVEPSKVSDAVGGIKEVLKLLSERGIGDVEVARARQTAKAQLFKGFECHQNLNEFLARFAAIGNPLSPRQYLAAIDQVNEHDLRDFAKRLNASKPSVGIVGDIWEMPSL